MDSSSMYRFRVPLESSSRVMLSSQRLWPARLSSRVACIIDSSGGFQRIADDLLGLLDDGRQMTLAAEALGINLVKTLCSGRPGRKPAARGHDLQSADQRVISGRAGELGGDRLARERGGAHGLRRQTCNPDFFVRRR